MSNTRDTWGPAILIIGIAVTASIWMLSKRWGLSFNVTVECLSGTVAVLVAAAGSYFYGDDWLMFRFSNLAPLLLAALWAAWWPALDAWDTVWAAASPLDYNVAPMVIRNGAWWASGWAKWIPVLGLGGWSVQRMLRSDY